MRGRLMSPAHETQSMREIRLLRGRLPRKGGGLTGTVDSRYLEFDGTMEKIRVNRSSTQEELRRFV